MLVVVIINIIDRQFSKEEEAVGTPLAEHMYSGNVFTVKQTTVLKAGCFPTQHWKCLRKIKSISSNVPLSETELTDCLFWRNRKLSHLRGYNYSI